jgi:hypothetical protein
VRIQFDADELVGLWARPFRSGKPVTARTNPSAKYTGSLALGWVEFTEAPKSTRFLRAEAQPVS